MAFLVSPSLTAATFSWGKAAGSSSTAAATGKKVAATEEEDSAKKDKEIIKEKDCGNAEVKENNDGTKSFSYNYKISSTDNEPCK
jgi:hypothetical protein